MRVSPFRCLKCGTIFTAAQGRYCTCCFADETYLKPALPEVPATAEAPRPNA